MLEERLAEGAIIYGVNTGYGAEAVRSIPPDALARMQRNTVTSHACGVGQDAPEEISRGLALLTLQSAVQGAPAYRLPVVEALVSLLNEGPFPRVPMMGSQSASDLPPAAHLALALDVELEAKDSGFINTCAFTGALALEALREAEGLIESAEEIAAMTLQAVRGHAEAYDERYVSLRPHPGALESAAHMRELLDGSRSTGTSDRPHDPFSLRALPQVHGAVRATASALRRTLEIEVCAVTDNPVVTREGDVLSGGNFHGAALGLPLDGLSLALGELAAMSRCRTQFLVAGTLGTPRKLTPDPTERFGLLLLPSVAGALVSEARQRGAAASRESIGFDFMEDHMSMSALAGRQALDVASLVRHVLCIELLCAAQALDFTGVELAAEQTRELHASVRERIDFVDTDRPVNPECLADLVGHPEPERRIPIRNELDLDRCANSHPLQSSLKRMEQTHG